MKTHLALLRGINVLGSITNLTGFQNLSGLTAY